MGITKIKKKLSVSRIMVLTPQSQEKHFIDRIEVDGSDATVYMVNRTKPYHYILTPDVKALLIKTVENSNSLGKFYNTFLRGKEVQ